MKIVNVELGHEKPESFERSYHILIKKGLIAEVGSRLADLGFSGRACVITNPAVRVLYCNDVVESLEGAGFSVLVIEIPDGEEFKNLEEASKVYDRLIDEKFERTSPIVALGGGVVGDLAGFVAATYLRGVPFVQMPTTLLAQVDSSVGGKTGVNHAKGKNLIGAFYQPRIVLIDPDALATLDEREVSTGLAEVVKHGVIRDADFFEFLEVNSEKILNQEAEIEEAISRSCEIKAEVVSEDEKEAGVRAILNFGHTFGHAVEVAAGYNVHRHGEAVGMGMVMAAGFSAELGFCSPKLEERIRNILSSLGLPTDAPDLKADDMIEAMYLDKKVQSGRIRFVLLKEIGEVVIKEADEDVLRKYLEKIF
ncbi:MAG: 3-dehydroquinate synthase [Thermodesulfobacteriota bacterium]